MSHVSNAYVSKPQYYSNIITMTMERRISHGIWKTSLISSSSPPPPSVWLYNMYRGFGADEFLWSTYMDMDTTGGPILTCSQQGTRATDRTWIKDNATQKYPVRTCR